MTKKKKKDRFIESLWILLEFTITQFGKRGRTECPRTVTSVCLPPSSRVTGTLVPLRVLGTLGVAPAPVHALTGTASPPSLILASHLAPFMSCVARARGPPRGFTANGPEGGQSTRSGRRKEFNSRLIRKTFKK